MSLLVPTFPSVPKPKKWKPLVLKLSLEPEAFACKPPVSPTTPTLIAVTSSSTSKAMVQETISPSPTMTKDIFPKTTCSPSVDPFTGELPEVFLQRHVQTTSDRVSGAELYTEACKQLGVVPVTYFIRNIDSPHMNLNHHGLGPKGARALAIALVNNNKIISMGLEDNWILGEGAKYFAEMLKQNCFIQDLNLSNNHLQYQGAEAIAKLLPDNIGLKSIQLSGNEFREESARILSEYLSFNYRIKELDLSHNEFSEKGGELLGQMLASNEGLEVLNLSWNHLRLKGSVAVSAGLKVNTTLKSLDLSWNGFGNEGALALGEALKFNNVLLHLDVSSNHITNEGARMLCKGLEVNDTLKVLKLALNPLTVEGAFALLTTVKNSLKSVLEELDLSNVLVNENFLELLEATCQERPSLQVKYGGVGGFIAKKPKRRPDPMKIIQVMAIKEKLYLSKYFSKVHLDKTSLCWLGTTYKIQVLDFIVNHNQKTERSLNLEVGCEAHGK
ncbi:leucine-rich repeat-containing protein 74A-like [Protopterus annectens]|uniref:leucine-rich repeat-containing protein 74A-like n=1 Tax=Protopterus annectens TaxID=7888 RepID=UPI001CFAB091|nr:leucine-rich repeat-containing protein 74A-like [Protopterus annectens]